MKLLAPLLLLLAALVATVAVDDTPRRADLVVVNSADVFTLDPQRMSYLADFRLAHALYEGLVRWDNHDFTVEPAAAAAPPEVSADRLTWTFRLAPEARWSNGDPVTAHDFVYAWRRALLPDTAADYSNMLFMIEGAEDFFRWRAEALAAHAATPGATTADAEQLWARTEAAFAERVGVEALDDRTLRVRLRRPVPYALDLFCFSVFFPVHRPSVEGWEVDDATAARMRERGWAHVEPPPLARRRWLSLDPATGRLEQRHAWARPGRLVSNGPYVLARWRYKRDLRLERNDRYHRPRLVRNDSVLALTVEEANTRVLAFESGGVDWLSEVGADYESDMLAAQQAGARTNVHAIPAFGTDFYSFNCRPRLADGRPNPFHDAAVRRAFVQSVDRDVIVEQVTRLDEPVLTTLIPPGSIDGYESPAGLGHDPDAARRVLAAAGWTDRDGDGLVEDADGTPFPVVDVLWTTSTSRYKWISLELKAQWERALGVRVELRGEDTKFYKEDLKQGKFMVARGRWYGDYGDPTTFLDLCRTGDGNNDRGFSSPRVDELLDRAAAEPDPAARMALLSECERVLFQEEVPMLVVCQLVQVYMFEPDRLEGLSRHPRLTQYLWQMRAGGS
ncbi:MAG: peptide ABC transporter substrate-binding protein [Planctomycetota bacterium]|jgi:oligopeptide transport system substrate-binding protein